MNSTVIASGCDTAGAPLQNLWWLGMTISMFGSFCSALGLNLQKKAHNECEANGTDVFKDRKWVAGLCLIVLNSIVDIPTFGLAPQTLLASLAAVTLVYNVLLAPILLKEHLGKRDIAATCIIVTGTVISIVYSSHTDPIVTVSTIALSFIQTEVIIYGIAIVIFIGAILYHDYHRCHKKMNNQQLTSVPNSPKATEASFPADGTVTPAAAGAGGGGTATGTGVGVNWIALRDHINGFELGLASGCCGGQSCIFMKITIELVKSSIAGLDNSFLYFSTYLYIAILATLLFFQMRMLNSALACSDALFVVPVYQVSYILFSILGGGIFYKEFSCFTTLQSVLFPLGSVITMYGIYLLSKRKPKDKALQKSIDAPLVVVNLGYDERPVTESAASTGEEEEHHSVAIDEAKRNEHLNQSSLRRMSATFAAGLKMLREASTEDLVDTNRDLVFVVPAHRASLAILNAITPQASYHDGEQSSHSSHARHLDI